jgi:hypothetical protein
MKNVGTGERDKGTKEKTEETETTFPVIFDGSCASSNETEEYSKNHHRSLKLCRHQILTTIVKQYTTCHFR